PALPKQRGKNSLDKSLITKAIDARGPWFNSLNKIRRENNVILLPKDQWNTLSQKMNPVAGRLMQNNTLQQAMAGFNPNDIIKSSSASVGSIKNEQQALGVAFDGKAATEYKPGSKEESALDI